jgi:hypothetical protein
MVRTEDRLAALHWHYSVTWQDMLKRSGMTDFDYFDIHDGRDLLLAQLRAQLELQMSEQEDSTHEIEAPA